LLVPCGGKQVVTLLRPHGYLRVAPCLTLGVPKGMGVRRIRGHHKRKEREKKLRAANGRCGELVKKWGLAPAKPPETLNPQDEAGACPHFFTSSELS
jgi:hypothetical protein